MSNLAASLIGRVALWNGSAYVTLDSYDKECDSYAVTALKRPEHVCPAVVPAVVEATTVEVFPLKSFLKRFPNPSMIKGQVPGGTTRSMYGKVIDISNGVPEDLLHEGVIAISTSCMVKGAPPVALEHDHAIAELTTCIDYPVFIDLNHSNDIVEFEDIHFRGGSPDYNSVLCASGKAIVFRRCQFSTVGSSDQCAVRVISYTSNSKKLKPNNVIFESCLFVKCASCEYSAIHVETPASVVVALNCTFTSNVEGGLVVDTGGNVTMKHCTFRDDKGGTVVRNPNS